MNELRIKFYDMMRAAHVKRWHVINTARQETLAEHSWLVAVIALELRRQMINTGREEATMEPVLDVLQLIGYAMFHDLPEVMMGDLPGNRAKDLFKKHGGPNIFTAIESEIMPDIPYTGTPESVDIKRFVHMADKIQALWFIAENGVGRQAKMAEGHCRKTLLDYIIQCEEETAVDWHTAVNHVLMSLSMPYVSRDTFVSPP